MNTLLEVRPRRSVLPRRSAALFAAAIPRWAFYPIAVYLASRVLFLLVAGGDSIFQHVSLQNAMSHWDGLWYISVAANWYPHTIPTRFEQYSNLGFMPVYPMAMWALSQLPGFTNFGAGLAISLLTGALAILNMSRLAAGWWDEQASRRAILFVCLFPGTIVFSMTYSEGLMLALVTGCLLALQRRRWVTAGACAGLASGIEPVALAIIPTCAAASFVELRNSVWRDRLPDREALRSLIAPLLAPVGVVGFAIFLWFWVGTPFGNYMAQSHAWGESTTPLAVPDMVGSLVGEIVLHHSIGNHGPGFDLDDVTGVLGAIVMVYGLARIWVERHRFSVPAIVWTFCVAFLALTSAKTPPNPRMLLCAFPILLLIGAEVRSRRARFLLLSVNVVLLLTMSWLTFVGDWLRP